LETLAGKQRQDILNRVLCIFVNRSDIILSISRTWDQRFAKVEGCVRKECKGIEYEYDIRSPFCWHTKVNHASVGFGVFPAIKEFNRIDKRLGGTGDDRSVGCSLTLISQCAELDVGKESRVIFSDVRLEYVKAVIEVKNAEGISSGYERCQ